MSAATTVMRSRFFSTTVEPAAEAPSPPPNMSDRPPPFPLCRSTRRIRVEATIVWITTTTAVSTAATVQRPTAAERPRRRAGSAQGVLDDAAEVVRLQAGAAHERAVDVGLAH